MSDATLTLQCNNNCIFCPRDYLKDILIGCDLDSIKEGIDKIRSHSGSITLSGGEVTILPYFFDIVKHCRKVGFKRISLITNGRMMSNAHFARKAAQLGLTDAGVSVYSTDPEAHDRITQTPGSFEQTLQGLKNCLDLFKHVWVNITASKFNQDSLARTIQELEILGVEEFLVISVISDEEGMMYDQHAIKEQLLSLASKKRVIFKGFPKGTIPERFSTEPHEFNTFVPVNKDSQNYLRKVKRISEGIPKSLADKTNQYAYIALKLADDDLYPPMSFGSCISKEEVLEGWADTAKGIRNRDYPEKLGIYVHIPFCVTKCKFCYCGSIELPRSTGEVEGYLDFLEGRAKTIWRN